MAGRSSRGTSLNRRRGPAEKLSARRLAWWVLLRVERGGAYASILLDRYERRVGDPRDAALLHGLVLGVLRRQAQLDHVIARVSSRPAERMDPEVRIVLRIGAYELLFLDRIPDFATVDSAVELVKGTGRRSASAFVNAVLRGIARQGSTLLPPLPEEGDVGSLALYHSHPAWWVGRVVARLGWRAAGELLESDNRPAAAVLRPNFLRTDSAELASTLQAEGLLTEPCRFVPEALRVRSGAVARSRALDLGLAWVQDEASQLVPRLFGTRIGPRVADLCAAPGGKSLQLAQALEPGALLVAADRHPRRLTRLVLQARRLGLSGILPLGAEIAPGAVPLSGTFDQVLVDAPCSGTGTLRRHPEIRWRLRPEALPGLSAQQGRLLDAAASLVAPGGSLVYSVCSMEPEEGERVVLGFLERHRRFRTADPEILLPQPLRSPDGFLRTSPLTDGLDGFFAALLVREPASR